MSSWEQKVKYRTSNSKLKKLQFGHSKLMPYRSPDENEHVYNAYRAAFCQLWHTNRFITLLPVTNSPTHALVSCLKPSFVQYMGSTCFINPKEKEREPRFVFTKFFETFLISVAFLQRLLKAGLGHNRLATGHQEVLHHKFLGAWSPLRHPGVTCTASYGAEPVGNFGNF